MKKTLLILSLLVSACSSEREADVQSFMNKNCVSCHQDEVYENKKKGLKDLGDLETQLHRCFSANNLNVDHQTENALMDYLNKKFYHFPATY